MSHTDSVAHDPSDRVRRGHLPALRAGRKLRSMSDSSREGLFQG
jgi:hypothetical protein